MKKINLFISLISLFLIFQVCTSCVLFENDVTDFMEKYTETAAIENHTFEVEIYNDNANNICVSSEETAEINFFMRNPKKYELVPSVAFELLDEGIDRSSVQVIQTDSTIIQLKMPQDFLIASDEGKDISAKIGLYEPMSGRNFDFYTVNLKSNTKPPLILNPTIINNGGSSFVIAFDMPNSEDMAIRHKDVCAIEIDGVSYPVTVSSSVDSEGNPKAEYAFENSSFTREYQPSYIFINRKSFTHTDDSVYFETGIPFATTDKEFNIVLKDSAGLSSAVTASTKITKLEKPLIIDQNGSPVREGSIAGIPFNEDSHVGKISIIPPTKDHLGNDVSGATVYYKVYEATGRGIIYTSGATTEVKEISLPQNTYRVEAYAALTNYENSATTTVKFRFVNNVLYVQEGFDNGDGSELAPFATIAQAIADINSRPNREVKFTICVEGDFTSGTDGNILLSGSINTDELIIQKKQGSTEAKFTSIVFDASLSSATAITLGDVTVTNGSGNGITQNSDTEIILKDTVITGCSGTGILINAGTIFINNASVTGCQHCGVEVGSSGTLKVAGSSVVRNNTRPTALSTEPANVVLPANKLIVVPGSISSGCSIGVTTDSIPEGSTKIQFTSSGTSMGFVNAFFSDMDYLVVPNGSGLALAIYSGSVSYTAADYQFDLSMADVAVGTNMGVYPGHTKTYSLNPQIAKRSGTTNLYCKPENYKLYEDAAYTTMDPLGQTVSITAALYLDGIKVKDISVSGLTFTITADNLMVEGEYYKLTVKINYMGVLYTQQFVIECARNDDYL